jgi:hypothetical protein
LGSLNLFYNLKKGLQTPSDLSERLAVIGFSEIIVRANLMPMAEGVSKNKNHIFLSKKIRSIRVIRVPIV